MQAALLVQCEGYIYGAGYGAAYHWVVANAEEAHHLYVRRYGGRTGELSVRVHTTHGVGHTVRGWTCCHVVRVQGTTRAAA